MMAKSKTVATINLFAVVALLSGLTHARLGCKDEAGNDVDWFYVYKLPVITGSTSSLIKEGLGHFYLDNLQQTFQLSNVSLNESKGHYAAETLTQIYNRKSGQMAFLMYNDQTSKTVSDTRGHTKGVVAYDSDSGYWLIHSVPNFPNNADSYSWPPTALRNGQSMLCITFNSDTDMEKIAQQMKYNYPNVYSFELPSDLLAVAPTFGDVAKGIPVKQPPWFKKAMLVSLGGQEFMNYAKYTNFGKELYVDWVAPDLKANLFTETWRNSPKAEQLPSNCSGVYHVNNIKAISLQGVQFTSTKDHSKLAISDSAKTIVCVGDINRVSTQFVRGGGTTCAQLPDVWAQYNQSISDVEPCP